MLETIENRVSGRDYLVELGAPEFTSICPLTEAPDFGELTIRYVPDGKLFELKSLRDYLTSFRERRMGRSALLPWRKGERSFSVSCAPAPAPPGRSPPSGDDVEVHSCPGRESRLRDSVGDEAD